MEMERNQRLVPASVQLSRRILLYCAAALAALVAGGCTTDAGQSLIILQNQVPDDGCIISPSASNDFRSRGIIDVQASLGYIFTPVVQSQILDDTNASTSRVISVGGADVEVSFPGGFFSADEEASLRDAALTRFSESLSGSVQPDLGTTSFAFVIVPQRLLDRIGAKLSPGDSVQASANVVVFGDMDGLSVESNPFNYSVDVCNGCMKIVRGDCATLPSSFEPSPGGECNDLQDVALECCTTGGVEVCPAIGTGA